MEVQLNEWLECPTREYRTVPTPYAMAWDTEWPIPAPEVVRAALKAPLAGLWVDHVPTGAELTAMMLLYRQEPETAWSNPLATGDWDSYPYTWLGGHPEERSPQMVMPDAWFDHAAARQAPPALEWYEPKPRQSVNTVIGLGLSGSGHKEEALVLPALWRRGLLIDAEERTLANHVLGNASAMLWYQIILDEGWTVRRAAQVQREGGTVKGELCQLTNMWAKPPNGTPPQRNSAPETTWEIHDRCYGQTADEGPWPMRLTEEIAARQGYRRVE